MHADLIICWPLSMIFTGDMLQLCQASSDHIGDGVSTVECEAAVMTRLSLPYHNPIPKPNPALVMEMLRDREI